MLWITFLLMNKKQVFVISCDEFLIICWRTSGMVIDGINFKIYILDTDDIFTIRKVLDGEISTAFLISCSTANRCYIDAIEFL